jgi:molybdopterin converting factor small subunit
MTITVQYQTQIRRAVGAASERIDLPADADVAALLPRLAERHGDAFRRLVLADGQLMSRAILLFVNDTQVSPSARLADGDVVTLLAPMAGG